MSPTTLLNTLLAAVVGLLLAVAVVAVVEYLDDRVKDADAVQEVAGLSTLGTVARMKNDADQAEFYRLATLLYPRSAVAEAYRTLRTNVEFASVDAPIRTLLVTSSAPNEGKTVTAANLAVAFAQAGRPTILVDADLRKPAVHVIFKVPNQHGLTTMLRADAATVDTTAHATDQANLRIITTGPLPPNPAELLGSQRMRAIVERLRSEAELIIFDAPPASGGHRRGGHELLPGCHGPRGRCGAQPTGRRPTGTRGPFPGRCERAGRSPQPGPARRRSPATTATTMRRLRRPRPGRAQRAAQSSPTWRPGPGREPRDPSRPPRPALGSWRTARGPDERGGAPDLGGAPGNDGRIAAFPRPGGEGTGRPSTCRWSPPSRSARRSWRG